MSTLIEVEAAVDRMSYCEQEILLEDLARKLGARPPVTDESRTQRERWLQSPVLPVNPRFPQPVAPEDARRHPC